MPIIGPLVLQRRRPRRPSLKHAIEEARKAKLPVRSVRIEADGTIEIDVGNPDARHDEMTPEKLRKLL